MEDRLRSLEVAIRRLAKASKRSHTIVIPPTVMMMYIEDMRKGAKFVFPAKGTIKGGVMQVTSDMPKQGVTIAASLNSAEGAITQSILTLKSATNLQMDLNVDRGDVVYISGTPVVDENQPLSCTVSILWECDSSICTIMNQEEYIVFEEETEDAKETGTETEERSSAEGPKGRES